MGQPRRPPPEPLDVDAVRVVTFGTACWALALVVVLLLHGPLGAAAAEWAWTCASGLGLGLLGIWYCRRRRGRIRRARGVR